MATLKEVYPLSWPDGWPRTRIQDRRSMSSWKRNANQYREALMTELERMKCPTFLISSNVPLNQRGLLTAGGVEPPDVGVAVWFSRQLKKDFTWQDTLGIHSPGPTEDDVQRAYRSLAQVHHPDRGGDMAMFQKLTAARDQALRWISGRTKQQFDYVIACDSFESVRLNLEAIALTIRAIRQIERCGTSSLLERAYKGFAALPESAGASVGA